MPSLPFPPSDGNLVAKTRWGWVVNVQTPENLVIRCTSRYPWVQRICKWLHGRLDQKKCEAIRLNDPGVFQPLSPAVDGYFPVLFRSAGEDAPGQLGFLRIPEIPADVRSSADPRVKEAAAAIEQYLVPDSHQYRELEVLFPDGSDGPSAALSAAIVALAQCLHLRLPDDIAATGCWSQGEFQPVGVETLSAKVWIAQEWGYKKLLVVENQPGLPNAPGIEYLEVPRNFGKAVTRIFEYLWPDQGFLLAQLILLTQLSAPGARDPKLRVLTKAYIARAEEDKGRALELANLLRHHRIDAIDQSKVTLGKDEVCEIKEEIKSCDHFLVVLSEATAGSDQIERDLDLVSQLHTERKRPRPAIIPVIVGAPQGYTTPPSIAQLHKFDLRSENLSEAVRELAKQLTPEITFINEVDGDEERLFRKSVKVYEELFPVEERDPPENIEQWLREGRYAELYRDVYAVLHLGSTPIGMAFVTSYLKHHWTYGNYLGVLPCNRPNRMTETFLCGILKHLQELDPEMKGIVFEVEPVNWDCLLGAVKRGAIRGHGDEDEVITGIRRLRRLLLYHANGCVALLDSNRRPLLVRGPALDGSGNRDLEGEFILMLRLFGTPGEKPSAELNSLPCELLDFLYGVLYRDAFCTGVGGVIYTGYESKLQEFRQAAERSAGTDSRFGDVAIEHGSIRTLLSKLKGIAYDEGLSEKIAL
jgi:hypothetical protein